jgi:hypothetical protein
MRCLIVQQFIQQLFLIQLILRQQLLFRLRIIELRFRQLIQLRIELQRIIQLWLQQFQFVIEQQLFIIKLQQFQRWTRLAGRQRNSGALKWQTRSLSDWQL